MVWKSLHRRRVLVSGYKLISNEYLRTRIGLTLTSSGSVYCLGVLTTNFPFGVRIELLVEPRCLLFLCGVRLFEHNALC